MDKVTCIAFILYQSFENIDLKEIAIHLLNGDVSLRELRKDKSLQPHIVMAERIFKKNKINKQEIQNFAEKYLWIEV